MAVGLDGNSCEEEMPINVEPDQNSNTASETIELLSREDSQSKIEELLTGEDSQCQMDQNSRLILKFLYFSMFAAVGVIASFFPLYLKELGLSPSIIGTVLFFRPVGGFIAGIISPTIVAKFRNEWKALTGFSILFSVFMFSVSFLPSATFKEYCPSENFTQINDPIVNASRLSPANQTLVKDELRMAPKYENNGTHFLLNNIAGSVMADRFKLDFNDESSEDSNKVEANRFETNNSSWMFETNTLTLITIALTMIVFSGEFCFVSLDGAVHGITMRSLGKGSYSQYGVFRSWGAIGHGIGAILTGAVITLTVHEVTICERIFQRGDYHVMFYVFLDLALLMCFNTIIQKVPSDGRDKAEQKSPPGDLRRSLWTVRNITWLFVLFSRSMFYAVTQGFLYWHMDNIGASPILIGLANCITTTTEFLAFFVTPKLIEFFGETKLVGAGLLSYICRYILYSVIINPIYILPMEVLEGVAFACVWSSILSYLSSQVSQAGQIQLAGIIQALTMLGTGVGFLLSGALVEVLGSSAMFLTFAGIASITVLIFSLVQAVS